MANIFFKSANHRSRFLEAMQRIGKIYDGKLDPEYGSALYILASDLHMWNDAQDYISSSGITFLAMIEATTLSGGYSVLMLLAVNLFNDQLQVSPIEFMRLDDSNFLVALTAIQLRRGGYSVDDFKPSEGEAGKRSVEVRSVVIDWVAKTLKITDLEEGKHVLPLDQSIHVEMIGYPDVEEQTLQARELGGYIERGYIIERITFDEGK
jgi:hypothetical protein